MPRNPIPAIVRRLGAHEWVVRLEPVVPRLERLVRRASGGRHGVLDLAGLPSLELTVTGRRSGLPRTVSLLYVPDGEDFLLVGSNWGSPRHPAWSTNLSHADKAELHCGGERFPVSVTELRGAQRARAWLTAVHVWPGYEMEQRLASEREFRIFRLRRC